MKLKYIEQYEQVLREAAERIGSTLVVEPPEVRSAFGGEVNYELPGRVIIKPGDSSLPPLQVDVFEGRNRKDAWRGVNVPRLVARVMSPEDQWGRAPYPVKAMETSWRANEEAAVAASRYISALQKRGRKDYQASLERVSANEYSYRRRVARMKGLIDELALLGVRTRYPDTSAMRVDDPWVRVLGKGDDTAVVVYVLSGGYQITAEAGNDAKSADLAEAVAKLAAVAQ